MISPSQSPGRLAILLALGALAFSGCAPHAPDPPIGGRLSSGGRDTYPFVLRSGEALCVVVDQEGVDLAITLLDPEGTPLLTIDGPNGANGPEHLAVIAPIGGRYRLELTAASGTTGAYRLRVERLGPARARDRALAEGISLYARAEQLRRQPGSSSADSALEDYRQARGRFRAARAHLLEARSLRRIGVLQLARHEIAPALASLEQAFELYLTVGNDWERAPLYNDLGEAWRLAGEPERARQLFERALTASSPAGNPLAAATALNNLGVLHASFGELQQALSAYDRALVLWQNLGIAAQQAAVAHNLGDCYLTLGRIEEGLDKLRLALSLRRQQGDRRGQAETLTTLGWAHEMAGDLEAALAFFEQALSLRRVVGDRQGEAITLARLGAVHLRSGRPHQALLNYRSALELVAGDPRGTAYLQLGLAATFLDSGRAEHALELAQEAGKTFSVLEMPRGAAMALLALARAERRLGRAEMALRHVEAALAIVESVRGHLRSPWLRSSYFAGQQAAYECWIEILMELETEHPGQGHAERAFEASERARSRGLLEILDAARVDGRHRAPPELLQRERALRAKIDATEERRIELLSQGVAERVGSLEIELRSLLLDYEKIQGELAAKDAVSGSRIQPLGLRAIQGLLEPDTVLLAYFLGDERSFLWVVSHHALTSHVLAPRAQLEALARRFYELSARRPGRSGPVRAERAVAELSAAILGPAAGQLAGKRLVILGDGALCYVPFGALIDPTTLAERRPLLLGHEIVSLPSASVLAQLRQRALERSAPAGLLAMVADPVFERDDPRLARIGHPRQDEPEPVFEPGWDADLSQTSRDFNGRFVRLDAAAEEAEAILSLADSAETLRAVGLEAQREMVLAGGLEGYRILHFATHGLINARHPALSGIVLSLVDKAGRPHDGMLRLHDLFDLHLRADLVVLSACRTALGEQLRGEGIVGLAQGFFHAGATRLVASLWNVDDRATAELMMRFYYALLREGRPAAEALRLAQLGLREQSEWQAPFYWAAFVLQGDWR